MRVTLPSGTPAELAEAPGTPTLGLALAPDIGGLRPLFDDIVCPSLSLRADGTYRGELTDVPPTGEARAQALMDFASLQCTLRRPAHLLCPLLDVCRFVYDGPAGTFSLSY